MIQLGIRLEGERLRLDLLIKDLAQLGGVKANAQQMYESGLRFPRADYLAAIAEVGIDIHYVVSGTRNPGKQAYLNEEESEIIGSYRSMRRIDQQALRRIASTLSASAGISSRSPVL